MKLYLSTISVSYTHLDVYKRQNLLASKQTTTAVMLSIQTILLGLICFFVISTGEIQRAFLTYPWLIMLTFPVNYIIGRFTGLRLTEIFRFKELLDKEAEV